MTLQCLIPHNSDVEHGLALLLFKPWTGLHGPDR